VNTTLTPIEFIVISISDSSFLKLGISLATHLTSLSFGSAGLLESMYSLLYRTLIKPI